MKEEATLVGTERGMKGETRELSAGCCRDRKDEKGVRKSDSDERIIIIGREEECLISERERKREEVGEGTGGNKEIEGRREYRE